MFLKAIIRTLTHGLQDQILTIKLCLGCMIGLLCQICASFRFFKSLILFLRRNSLHPLTVPFLKTHFLEESCYRLIFFSEVLCFLRECNMCWKVGGWLFYERGYWHALPLWIRKKVLILWLSHKRFHRWHLWWIWKLRRKYTWFIVHITFRNHLRHFERIWELARSLWSLIKIIVFKIIEKVILYNLRHLFSIWWLFLSNRLCEEVMNL